MNIRRRQDRGNREVGIAPKNTNTRRVDGETQAMPVKNARSTPKPVGPTMVCNAVNGPKP